MLEWNEGEGEQEGGEEEGASCVEEPCAWVGSVIGELGGCRAVSDDVEMGDASEKIEMIVRAPRKDPTIANTGPKTGISPSNADSVVIEPVTPRTAREKKR